MQNALKRRVQKAKMTQEWVLSEGNGLTYDCDVFAPLALPPDLPPVIFAVIAKDAGCVGEFVDGK